MSSIDSRRRFQVLVSGVWWEGFVGQGSGGILWASSAIPGNADGAMGANFGAGGVNPVNVGNRGSGYGVRCLLNSTMILQHKAWRVD